MAWTQFRQRNSGRTFPTASTSLRSRHHHRCHRARSFVVENVHTCSHVERPLPSDISNITLCSFAQPAFGEKSGTRLTARWKRTDFSYCSIYLMCKPALIKNHWLIRYVVFLQDQVGSYILKKRTPSTRSLFFLSSFPFLLPNSLLPLCMHLFAQKQNKKH